jgi:hypothetical protein
MVRTAAEEQAFSQHTTRLTEEVAPMSNTITTTRTELSFRDRAVLRAISEGRCQVQGGSILIDGRYCSDQFVGSRLAEAALIAFSSPAPALTESGVAALTAA